MKRFLGCVYLLLSTVLLPGWSAADVYSTFSEDLDGWECPDSDSSVCTWNELGYLEFEDPGGTVTYAKAPAKFLGDWSGYSGIGYIHFRHKVIDTGDVEYYLPYVIQLSGEDDLGEECYAEWTRAFNPAQVGKWVEVNAMLIESDWDVQEGSWLDLLSNITDISISLEVVDNIGSRSDIAALDNVGIAIPRPCWCPASVVSTGCGDPEVLKGSEMFNELGMFILPIGALLLLRINYRNRTGIFFETRRE